MCGVQVPSKRYKICLIGDGGVGKTTYINRVLDGTFCKEYIATIGVACHPATFWISAHESIVFDVWDTAGQEKHAALKDIYYLEADGAIFFYDVTSRVSANNLSTWMRNFKNVVGNKPMVIVANKIDCTDRKANRKSILQSARDYDYDYCEISAKTTYNFAQPFLLLARRLYNNNSLVFVSNINLQPSELHYDDAKNVNEDYDIARNAEIEE
ncbi:hypothetical protein NCER_101711 [Vairimorpha ceranae BRL01]|uniref:Uncharacterized protein n=2 Tax=Vairimorpha ceranae TaxID=40302 RepID=C4VAL4_VAIC1|nr:gtp-binding nuclear protein [Vairimorpha ceranae]EEQ81740.1 hypothetical protein NCER_101711 [Vairimorpha ceranae BRL01]KAF5140772.1 hypothetical protein G9O61_00g010920 [Vairimorpha ceranae]KKO74975.1 gtp-binding nuclear protein [Vairimorpha ceranae]